MKLRRVAPIVIATSMALLSAPAGAQPRAGATEANSQRSAVDHAYEQTGASTTTVGADNGSAGNGSTSGSTPGPNPAAESLLPIPPPVDQEIAAVLENERRAAAVEDARKAAAVEIEAANAIVEVAQRAMDQAQKVVLQAKQVLDREQTKVNTAQKNLDKARLNEATKAQQAIDVGISMYVSTGGERDPRMSVAMAVLSGGQGIPDASAAKVYRDTLADRAFRDLESARRSTDRSKDKVERAEAGADRARVKLRSATDAADKVGTELAEAQGEVVSAKAQGDKQIAAAEASAPSLKSTELSGGLAILGDPLVSAKDLAAFVRQHDRTHSSIDIEKLAETYIAEGKAEGVRSDVAWVQSIIETGWFSFDASMVKASDYNYAGIGACDSCSRGIIFKSMTDGVRTQVQLLRTYATKNLKTKDLAHPPPRLAPEKSSVRGCCKTWMGLSGVWATGPGYGIKILTIYNQLLAFSAKQRLR